MLEALHIYIKESDETLPDAAKAREMVDQILPGLRPFGQPMTIKPFRTMPMPEVGRRWGIRDAIPLLPANSTGVSEEHGIMVTFAPTSKRFRGGFALRAEMPYEEALITDERIDERAQLLVEIAEDWLEVRPGVVAYLTPKPIRRLQEKANTEPLPSTVAWWTWINGDGADALGRDKLCNAPVYRAYPLAGGIAWQLTERFTQKPHPSLLRELIACFPGHNITINMGG
jgi:hypothetical protein